MFRNKDVTASSFSKKFTELKTKMQSDQTIHLNLGYYKELQTYIDALYLRLIQDKDLSDERFEEIREAEMSNLNRLQKLKNSSSYKKSKHKKKTDERY